MFSTLSYIDIDSQIPVATGIEEKELYLFTIHSLLGVLKRNEKSVKRKLDKEEDVKIQDLKRFCD